MSAGWALYAAGFRGYRIPTMIAIGQAESALDERAINLNTHDPQSPAYLSLDLGVWQINTYWWVDKRYRVQQLFDPTFNATVAWEVFTKSGGTNSAPVTGYQAWNTYRINRHTPFLSAAVKTWDQMGQP